MYLLACVVTLACLLWAFERVYLRGWRREEPPRPVDPDACQFFSRPGGPGPEHRQVCEAVAQLTARLGASIRGRDLPAARELVDSISEGRRYASRFSPVDAGGVPAEWVVAPAADGARRVLYIHGGGFVVGSPKSHRTITSKFSEVTSSAVLAIDYRRLPEVKLRDCMADCRTAYRWILDNGPEGRGEARQLVIAGDSAGGTLALSLAAWIRDRGLRRAEAVVALSPLTDCTFSGASIRGNEATDTMLGPVLRRLKAVPPFVRSWWVLWTYGVRPADPLASPLRGNLAGLPPTLVQASEAEMLLDDARRYVYKARAAGSPAVLQTWADMLHVWQIFEPELPQATEAWREIGRFIADRGSGPGQTGR